MKPLLHSPGDATPCLGWGQGGGDCAGRWFQMFLLGLLFQLVAVKTPAAPSLEVIQVPAFGSSEDLVGRVLEADPASHRVAAFIYVPSAGWWSKPYCDPDLTVIQPDGRWTADVTTGGADAFATKITALLVSSNYNQDCVLGLPALPPNVLTQALASATVVRADPNVRRLSFSGYDWWVKDSPALVGPGPNFFSESTNNVWVDPAGRLHLRITNRSNQWQCAEVVTERSFGYGHYRFEVESVVDNLNPSVVLGLFTWSDDPAYTHREIDVECGRWADSNDVNNAQFVVQPWDWPGHLVRYAVPAGLPLSTHLFTWETNRITFQSQAGSYDSNPAPTTILSAWVFNNASAVPQAGDENVRLNFWLIYGNPPTDHQEVEVVIRHFEFVPLGSPQSARLVHPQRTAVGPMQFDIEGQMDRRYRVEHSTDLAQWETLATVLATNSITRFVATGEVGGSARQFYRAVTLP
ncbi:MAG: glycoside hydrolase family 16 protein [Verrucomicrobia bacterium]|nr:glycoside hydrolase family 16 protein [Verrucomicrobiota bacterium]